MKQYVCIKTIEAVRISTAVKNEAGDWTVFGEGELHNIPSDQAKGFKFNKKSPGYLIRYGNGKVEHMTSAKFTATYGELVNGVYDGVFEDAIAKADEEAPHVDENLTQSNKRELEKTRKRSARVEVEDIVQEPVEVHKVLGPIPNTPQLPTGPDYPVRHVNPAVPPQKLPQGSPRFMQPHQTPPNPDWKPNSAPPKFKPVHEADEKNVSEQNFIDGLRNKTDAAIGMKTFEQPEVTPQELTYDAALVQLKMGNRLARRTWGPNRFIYLNRGGRMSRILEPLRSLFGDKVDFFSGPRFDFYNGSQYVSVYSCPIDDQLAKDWIVV